MTPQEILLAAATLLEEPGVWTTDTVARTKNGTPCMPWNAEAVCFCAEGAIRRYSPGDYVSQAVALIAANRTAFEAYGFSTLSTFNDSYGRTAAQVVTVLLEAAVRLEATRERR